MLLAQSPPPLAGRVQKLLAAGNLAGARAELTAAAQRSPADASVFNLLGIVEAQARNYRAAESAFQRAIRLAPRGLPAYENLGRLYQEHASEDAQASRKATETYRALLRMDPASEEGNFQLARLLAFGKDYAESHTHLQRLSPETLARPGALAILAINYAATARRDKALDAARRLLHHPDLIEADVTSIAPALESAVGEEVAVTLFEGLAARGLASPPALHSLAALYERSGRLPKARETLESAARVEGVNARTLRDLARVAFKQKDFEGTLGYLAPARELEPKNAAVHFFFAIASIELDLPVEAEKSLATALALDPSNAYYHYAFGAVKLQLEKYDEALAHLAAFRKAKPDNPRGTLMLGVAYFHAQQDEHAAEPLQRAAARPETAPEARYYLGRLALRQGDADQALKEFERAVASNAKYSEAYAEIGSVHLNARRFPEARRALDHALKLDPEQYRANLYLLTLYRRLRDPLANAQEAKFKLLREKQFEKLQFFMRTIQARPY